MKGRDKTAYQSKADRDGKRATQRPEEQGEELLALADSDEVFLEINSNPEEADVIEGMDEEGMDEEGHKNGRTNGPGDRV